MLAGRFHIRSRTEDRLQDDLFRKRPGQSQLDSRIRHCFNEEVNIRRAGTGDRRHQVQIGFLPDLEAETERRKDLLAKRGLFGSNIFQGIPGADAFAYLRRRIGHDPDDVSAVQFVQIMRDRNPGRDGHHQRFIGKTDFYALQSFIQELRFDRDENGICILHSLIIGRGSIDPELFAQTIDFFRIRVTDKYFLRVQN